MECILVERIALCCLMLYRAAKAEREFMLSRLKPPVYSRLNFIDYDEDSYKPVMQHEDVERLSSVYLRYQTTIENRLYKAMHELERLQRMRGRNRAKSRQRGRDSRRWVCFAELIMKKEIVRKLQLAFWNGYDVPAACLYAGITEQEFEKNMQPNSAFYWKMQRAQIYPRVKSQTEMVRRIANGDGRLAMKYLERRCPEEFDLQYTRKFGKALDD